MHRAQPNVNVTVIGRDGVPYGQAKDGWEIPPDPRGDSR
jgi:hypothetical protein